MSDTMKNYLDMFIDAGLVYKGNRYDFLLLKDLIEFARETELDVKIRDLKDLLIAANWIEKKAAVSTTEGFQSKDIWLSPIELEKTKSVPIDVTPRKNLIEAEKIEADRLVLEIFNTGSIIFNLPDGIYFSEDKREVVFTNKSLKELLVLLGANGSIPKLSSIIRSRSNKMLVGEHFFGTSSRTVLFKNYYKLKRG